MDDNKKPGIPGISHNGVSEIAGPHGLTVKSMRCTQEIIMGGASANKFVADNQTKLTLFHSIGVLVEKNGVKRPIPWTVIQSAELT